MTVPASRSILVSACLLGLDTRYDGTCRSSDAVLDFLRSTNIIPIPVCPEQLGGLPTPRPPAEFTRGDGQAIITADEQLFNRSGTDVSQAFLLGARQTLEIAAHCRCTIALLKERSPSCGTHYVYCNGELQEGAGVTATLLRNSGLKVFSEDDLVHGQFPLRKGCTDE